MNFRFLSNFMIPAVVFHRLQVLKLDKFKKLMKMEKKCFILYLIPPRSDFAQTMTEDEKSTMMNHVVYWTDLMNKGLVVIFGPVFDPNGVYGVGIVKVDSNEQLMSL